MATTADCDCDVVPGWHGFAQTAAPAPDAEELTRLLKYFLDGASRDDIAAHERFWADDLIYTRSAGVRIGKAEILADLRAAPPAEPSPPTTYTAEDIRIQQYGDMAIVAFRLVGTTGSGAGISVDHYLNTGTFLKRNGEWRAVAWQATRVPAKEAEVNLTPGATARAGLHDEILAADAALFKAFFDTCDIEALRGLVTDDFEMFHDKGGRGADLGRGIRAGGAGQVQAAGGWHRFPVDAQARAGEHEGLSDQQLWRGRNRRPHVLRGEAGRAGPPHRDLAVHARVEGRQRTLAARPRAELRPPARTVTAIQ